MKGSTFGRQCLIHNEPLVAIDLNPSNSQKFQHCCLKCMKSRKTTSQILIYSDAEKDFQDQKKEFLNGKETQIKKNRELLKQLIAQIEAIKNDYIQAFDKLSEYLNFQVQQTEQELYQIESKLQDLDFDSYLSGENEFANPENQCKGLKRIIERQLDEIQRLNLTPQCLDIVKVFDLRNIQLRPKMPIEISQQLEDDFKLGFLCPDHKKEIRFFDLNENIPKQKRLICEECYTKTGQYSKISEVYQQWQEYKRQSCIFLNNSLIKVNAKIEPLILLLQNYNDDHIRMMTTLIQELNQLKDELSQQNAEKINKQQAQWKQFIYNEMLDLADTLSQPNLIQRVSLQVEEQNEQIVCGIKSTIKRFFGEKKIVEMQLRDRLSNVVEFTALQINNSIINKIINGPANYQLIIQEAITQIEQCDVIAINSDQTTVIAGCNEKIKVFTFDNGNMDPFQILSQHNSRVLCLYFMKTTQSFISGSEDDSIVIWNYNHDDQWYCKQVIKSAHSNTVKHIIMNIKEDIMISCSKKIKFWAFKQEWGCFQILTIHDGTIYDLCLNDFQNLLVSCSECEPGIFDKSQGQVFISQIGSDNCWQVIQKIKSQTGVFRVCFIGDYKFIIQKNQELVLFEKNEKKLQFDQKYQFQVQCYDQFINFPLIYNRFKQLLVCKLQSKIGLMKFKSNGEFEIDQVIQQNTWGIFGIMSDDGEYLITWDDFSKEFKVRKSF